MANMARYCCCGAAAVPCTDCDPGGAGTAPNDMVISGAVDGPFGDMIISCAGPYTFAYNGHLNTTDYCRWSWSGTDTGPGEADALLYLYYVKNNTTQTLSCGSVSLTAGKYYVYARIEDNVQLYFSVWNFEEATGYSCDPATGQVSGTHTFAAGHCAGTPACTGNLTMTVSP